MARRPGGRVVRRIDVRSVARLSAVVYLSLLGVLLAVGVVVWVLASLVGLVGRAERFVKDLFGFATFHFAPLRMLVVVVIVGLILVAVGTLANVVAAAVYNLVARAVGGVEVIVAGDETAPSAPRPARRPIV